MNEPAEGLLKTAESFSKIGEPREAPAGPRFHAEQWQTLMRHYLAVHDRFPHVYYFFCTVYYTPMEAGFTAEAGFDVTPDGRSQLGSRRFAKSFLRAVVMEGFGRLEEPASGGREYVKYWGSWGYDTRALGNRNNTLKDRTSAAVHRRNTLFSKGTPMQVLDPHVWNTFGGSSFEAADTGGGLFRSQIDLYWGEDYPMGPEDLFRPASCDLAVSWIVPVLVGY